MSRIKAVAFDIDGTLYPNYRMYMLSIRLFITNMRLLRAFQTVRKELRSIRPIEDFHAMQTLLISQRLGKGIEETRKIIIREFYTSWENVFHSMSLYSHVVKTLSWIKEKGISLAVLSDFPVNMKLKLLKIENYFDVAVCAEDSGYLKPNPEPFQYMLKELGLHPQEVLYVGNDYNYDILGASSLGIKTAHLSLWAPFGTPAKLTFSSYRTFLAWLKEQC